VADVLGLLKTTRAGTSLAWLM